MQIATELFDAAKQGTRQARDALIIALMPCVPIIVNSYVRRHKKYRRLREDLEGEGYVKLVQTVDRLLACATASSDNLPSYARHAVALAMYDSAEYLHSGFNIDRKTLKSM